MAILTKKELLEAVQKGEISFSPSIDAFQLQPASIDLRVGWSFYTPYTWKFNEHGRVAVVADYTDYMKVEENVQLIKLKPGQYFEILPGESVIASTLEKISINNGNMCGVLHPRSSSSRRGLGIDSGVIDPFYSGNLIIPMKNNSHHVLKIYPGERICQVLFQDLKSGLTKEEATKHGMQDAKYNTATPYNLGIKPDSKEELELLKNGKIEELKNNFKVA